MSNIIDTIGGTALGLMLQGHNDRRQVEQQRKLGEQQLGFNIQQMGAQKAMDLQMWKDTNYSAQVEEINKAGLNPALLYGKGGGGGTTVGNSGGGVNAPNAPQGGGEVMGMMMQQAQLKVMEAQAEAMKADANLKNVDANKKAGVDTELGKAQTESLMQGIKNQQATERLTNIESRLRNIQADIASETIQEQIASVGLEMQTAAKQLEILTRNSWIDENTKYNKIKIVQTQLFGMVLDNALTKAQTAGVNQNIAESKQRILQEWNKINQGWKYVAQGQQGADANSQNASTNMQRLEYDKFIDDVSKSTQMTVETVKDLIGMILGAGPKTVIHTRK